MLRVRETADPPNLIRLAPAIGSPRWRRRAHASSPQPPPRRVLLLAVTGCSTMGVTGHRADPGPDVRRRGWRGRRHRRAGHPRVVPLPKALVRRSSRRPATTCEIRAAGDGGTLTAKLAMTNDNPTGDVAFGVDNTFASRAARRGRLRADAAELPPGADQYVLGDGGERLIPVDTGDVCVNVDTAWFDREGIAPPKTLDDLADPAYEDLFVTPGVSSSPGMAFLMSTSRRTARRLAGLLEDLLANGAKVVDGWTDAYYGDFTGGSEGNRPIVLSYDSSPAFTVQGRPLHDRGAARHLLPAGGVRRGAGRCRQPRRRPALIEWLLGEDVQAALPTSMYVYPVSDDVEVPADWARYAAQPTDP